MHTKWLDAQDEAQASIEKEMTNLAGSLSPQSTTRRSIKLSRKPRGSADASRREGHESSCRPC
jgi:hypothetical protein